MKLSDFIDQLNEIRFFVDSKRDSVFRTNYLRLRRLSAWLFAVYAVGYFWFVIYSENVWMNFAHIIPLAVMFLFARLLKNEGWICASWKRIRAAAVVYYLAAVAVLLVFSFHFQPQTLTAFFAVAFPVMALMYIDDPLIFGCLELGCFAVYFAAAVMSRRNAALMVEELFVGLLVAAVSMMCYWSVMESLTEDSRGERALKQKGDVDLLTGLLNKVSFEQAAAAYLNARQEKKEGALLIIDFDNFKHVNDKFGHLTGDAVLKRFGKILQNNFRVEDIIGRVGGDEFMVMMTGSVSDDTIKTRCDNIQHELYVSRFGEAGSFSCSIGVAVDMAGYDFKSIYRVADDALYEAKARGKARFISWYTSNVQVPEKKIVYIATPRKELRGRIKGVLGDAYTYMESAEASKALNDICIYQEYLESVYLDYNMPDMEEAVLRRYINSRPIFSQIPVHDVDTEL